MILWKQDADGNLIGRSNQNPILDTCLMRWNFLGGEIIAESMYAQCDVNGNDYLLLEDFVNHSKYGSALSVEYPRIIVKG